MSETIPRNTILPGCISDEGAVSHARSVICFMSKALHALPFSGDDLDELSGMGASHILDLVDDTLQAVEDGKLPWFSRPRESDQGEQA
jgi:hypothetical protein